MNTQFDVTKISNLIMKSFEREMLKEIPSESISDAVYCAWLKKQYAKAYKSMPAHIRLMCGFSDEMIYQAIEENTTKYEIDIDNYIHTEECIKIYKHFLKNLDVEDEIINEYEKYSQIYYSLCYEILNKNIMAEQEVTKQEIILPSEYPEIWERTICEKCPWIIPFLIILQIIMIGITVKELGTGLVDFGQEAIVRIEGKQDIFYVESDSAKIYSEPTVHSKIVGEVYYSDKVKRIDGINMWDNIFYYDEKGELVIGWIASKEIITYREWKNY